MSDTKKRQRNFYLWHIDTPDDKILCCSQTETAKEYNLNLGNLNSVLNKYATAHRDVCTTVNGYGAAWADEVDAQV